MHGSIRKPHLLSLHSNFIFFSFFISFSGQNEIKSMFFQTHYISATAGIFNLHYPSCCEGQISFDLNYLKRKKGKKNSPRKDSHKIPDWVYLALFSLRKEERTSRLPAYAWPWLDEEVPERKKGEQARANYVQESQTSHLTAPSFIPLLLRRLNLFLRKICVGN